MTKFVFILSIFTILLCTFECLPSWRIIGGKEAVEGQVPWQAQIRIKDNNGTKHHCGGSIIAPQWILTAAHCVIYRDINYLEVAVGSVHINSTDNVYNVSKAICHINYDDRSANDIALVKLSSSIETFGKNINKIDLETQNVDNVNCIASGWGSIEFQRHTDILRYLDTKTIPISECRRRLYGISYDISENFHVCTFSASVEDPFRPTVCHGDSGGPLVCEGKQVGIVSFGDPVCSSGTAVYTKVSNYVPWINNIMDRA